MYHFSESILPNSQQGRTLGVSNSNCVVKLTKSRNMNAFTDQRSFQGLFTLERVGSSPKAQVVPRLEDEGHWKRGTFPRVVAQIFGVSSKRRAMAH
jgi:hypothetical protein